MALALALTACGGGGGPGEAAPTTPAAGTGSESVAAALSVMSYNMHWGGPSGSRLAEVADIIAASGADLVSRSPATRGPTEG